MTKPVVLSGVQPSGDLHLGNYIGALRPWARSQRDYQNFFCVVDLHALTVPEAIASENLRERTREVAALYLAAGISPEEATIFAQSDVPQHAELMWLLNCVTPIGWLERMTQYKSKSGSRQVVGSGLLTYPVLMAADILLYDADIVPVGDDQRQHIELTRDIANRFNSLFGQEVFKTPEARIPVAGARVMGLDDPTEKMSKSTAGRSGHAVNLLDPLPTARKKIMRAQTDALLAVTPADLSAGVANLLQIFAALQDQPVDVVTDRFAGHSYGELKRAVADAVCAELEVLQRRYAEVREDRQYLDTLLEDGAAAARARAVACLQRARQAVGLT